MQETDLGVGIDSAALNRFMQRAHSHQSKQFYLGRKQCNGFLSLSSAKHTQIFECILNTLYRIFHICNTSSLRFLSRLKRKFSSTGNKLIFLDIDLLHILIHISGKPSSAVWITNKAPCLFCFRFSSASRDKLLLFYKMWSLHLTF